jgi:hypothetical protein
MQSPCSNVNILQEIQQNQLVAASQEQQSPPDSNNDKSSDDDAPLSKLNSPPLSKNSEERQNTLKHYWTKEEVYKSYRMKN